MSKTSLVFLSILFSVACTPPADTAENSAPSIVLQGVGTYTLSAGVNDDVPLPTSSSSTVALTVPSGGATLAGIDTYGINAGYALILTNAGPGVLTIGHNASSSTIGYRLGCPDAAAYTLPAGRAAWVQHDGSRWAVLAAPANTGPTGAAGAGGAAGATGATGPGALVVSSFTPTLTVGGAGVQLDATHDVDYSATISFSGGTVNLTGGVDTTVSLYCDAGGTPTAFADAARLGLTGTLVVGLALQPIAYGSVRARVPASWYCRLVQTTTTGTQTIGIVGQVGRVLGN